MTPGLWWATWNYMWWNIGVTYAVDNGYIPWKEKAK